VGVLAEGDDPGVANQVPQKLDVGVGKRQVGPLERQRVRLDPRRDLGWDGAGILGLVDVVQPGFQRSVCLFK